MIRRITGIILGVVAFLLVYWLSGLGTPSQPNLALALLVGLVVGLIWPWVMGILIVRRHRAKKDAEMQAEMAEQVAEQTKSNPS
jgi:preprotein translocase subunit SecF